MSDTGVTSAAGGNRGPHLLGGGSEVRIMGCATRSHKSVSHRRWPEITRSQRRTPPGVRREVRVEADLEPIARNRRHLAVELIVQSVEQIRVRHWVAAREWVDTIHGRRLVHLTATPESGGQPGQEAAGESRIVVWGEPDTLLLPDSGCRSLVGYAEGSGRGLIRVESGSPRTEPRSRRPLQDRAPRDPWSG